MKMPSSFNMSSAHFQRSPYLLLRVFTLLVLSEKTANLTVSNPNAARPSHDVLAIPGDIIFGGLFPVHEQDSIKGCGKIDPERGIQRLEAMLFTLDKINVNMSHLLPGIRLGALVMDTCGSDYIALERSLEIVQTAAIIDGATSQRERDYSNCLRNRQPKPVISSSNRNEAEMKQAVSSPTGSIGLGLMPGLIGAASSTESIQVASLFRLFRIPMISYASTSAELSDKKRYEFFARTVPSDIFQSKAVIDILLSFDWTYVSVIYSDGDYGSSLFEAFLRRASTVGICIAHVAKLSKRGEISEFREHVRALVEKERARVVVLFIASKDVRQFLKAVTLEIAPENLPYFQWVASDGWGTQKSLLSDTDASLASDGAITLEIKSGRLPGFDEYFRRLMANPETNTRNPWFREFCETSGKVATSSKVSFPVPQVSAMAAGMIFPANSSSGNKLTKEMSSAGSTPSSMNSCMTEDNMQQDSKTIFVHNAVYAMALALREIQRRTCGKKHVGLCEQMLRSLQAASVYRTILNVTFTDPIGRIVKFDDVGDAVGHYNIYKYRRDKGQMTAISSKQAMNANATHSGSLGALVRFKYDRVGEWNGRLQYLKSMRVHVPIINYTKVQSKCSETCGVGQAMRILVKGCCWECQLCSPWQYVFNSSQCLDCEAGFWPDVTRTSCIRLEEKHIDFFSWYVVLSAVVAFLGMAITTIAIAVYFIFRETPLVKASSIELSFIIMAGCFLTFLTTFFYLIWPTLPICIIRRLSFGLGIACIYSALAVKINRIYRIFEAASKTSQQPPMISPESQLMLVACFVGIQLALSLVSLLFDPPNVTDFNPSGDRRNWYKVCTITARSYALLMVLTIILIIGATYYAIRTRNCPEPYREARVVGFSVYTTCIIWLAFVPLFFSTSSSVELQTTVICISLSLCSWVVLACLFAQRLYIIVFRPSKNVKPGKFTLSAAVSKNASMVTKLAMTRQQEKPSLSRTASPNNRESTRKSCVDEEGTSATATTLTTTARVAAVTTIEQLGNTVPNLVVGDDRISSNNYPQISNESTASNDFSNLCLAAVSNIEAGVQNILRSQNNDCQDRRELFAEHNRSCSKNIDMLIMVNDKSIALLDSPSPPFTACGTEQNIPISTEEKCCPPFNPETETKAAQSVDEKFCFMLTPCTNLDKINQVTSAVIRSHNLMSQQLSDVQTYECDTDVAVPLLSLTQPSSFDDIHMGNQYSGSNTSRFGVNYETLDQGQSRDNQASQHVNTVQNQGAAPYDSTIIDAGQEDIASILDKHEHLRTINGGRIIAICNESVIDL